MTTYILYNPLAGSGDCKKDAQALEVLYDNTKLIDVTQITNYPVFLGGLEADHEEKHTEHTDRCRCCYRHYSDGRCSIYRFQKLVGIRQNKERLIDGLVKAIYLYDDKLVFYLTYTDDPVTIPTAEELEAMEHSSDVNALSSPKDNTTQMGGVIFSVRESKGRLSRRRFKLL